MKGGSTPRVTAKVAAAIEHLLDGSARTQGEAADLAGISRETLCRSLKKPHVEAYVIERARRYLTGLPALRAAARLAQLIDAKSEDVASRVATRIAENAGVIRAHDVSHGAIAGGGIAVIIDFGGGESVRIGAQLGAPAVQSATDGAQTVEATASFEGERDLDKGAPDRNGGPGAR